MPKRGDLSAAQVADALRDIAAQRRGEPSKAASLARAIKRHGYKFSSVFRRGDGQAFVEVGLRTGSVRTCLTRDAGETKIILDALNSL